MAITFKLPNGKADITGITPSGTQKLFAYGPPVFGAPQTRGVFIKEVDGSNGTFRWLGDENTPGVASPAAGTYSYDY